MRTAAKKWRTRGQVDQYVRDLEEVYGMDIEMRVTPILSSDEKPLGVLEVTGWWKGDDHETGPVAYHSQVIALKPELKTIANMTNALVHFTYQCIEASIEALPLRS